MIPLEALLECAHAKQYSVAAPEADCTGSKITCSDRIRIACVAQSLEQRFGALSAL